MRDVRFKVLPATGAGEGPWEYCPLDEFLMSIPAFAYALCAFEVVPPKHVFNEILNKGENDAGMGGGAKWKPFEIAEAEYEELVENLVTNPNYKIIEDKELWEKINYTKWHGALISKYAKKLHQQR